MSAKNWDEAIKEILKKDKRYHPEAYRFVMEALDYTMKRVGERRHVSGQELLMGIKELSLQYFLMLGKLVFNNWGIRSCEDFGEIVFNMVEAGLMGKQPTDSKEDFKNGFDFDETFEKEAKNFPAQF